MELFLNLCWLSLLVPAWLLWRERAAFAGVDGHARTKAARPLIFICALGCAFVLLFPVISASDDLHAMRAEMEESSPGKRTVSQAAGEKVSMWNSRGQHTPAMVRTPASFRLTSERLELFTTLLTKPAAHSIVRSSRAPPLARLA